MKQTKNDRLGLLKTASGLGAMEFSHKSKISHGTIYNLEHGGNFSPKTEKTLIKSFNLNKEWWETGKGDMFSNEQIEVVDSQNPWKEALISEMKEEISYLRNALMSALGNNPNFQEATDFLRAA